MVIPTACAIGVGEYYNRFTNPTEASGWVRSEELRDLQWIVMDSDVYDSTKFILKPLLRNHRLNAIVELYRLGRLPPNMNTWVTLDNHRTRFMRAKTPNFHGLSVWQLEMLESGEWEVRLDLVVFGGSTADKAGSRNDHNPASKVYSGSDNMDGYNGSSGVARHNICLGDFIKHKL